MKAAGCILVLNLTLMLGCAGTDFKNFDPKGEAVRSIALITVPDPSVYQVVDWGGTAGLFAAAGGAVTQYNARTMGEKFGAAAKEASFDFGREMQAAVTQALRQAGFNVVSVHAGREAPEKLLADYSKVPTAGTDALLDIDARVVGYSTYNIKDPDFRPHIHVDVRLVSAKTRAVLYSEQVLFGYHNPYMSATQLPSDKRYYFKGFNALMANKPLALAGIKHGTEVIAAHIVARLKPQ